MTGSMYRLLAVRVVSKREKIVKTSWIKSFRQIHCQLKKNRQKNSKKTFMVYRKNKMRVNIFLLYSSPSRPPPKKISTACNGCRREIISKNTLMCIFFLLFFPGTPCQFDSACPRTVTSQ